MIITTLISTKCCTQFGTSPEGDRLKRIHESPNYNKDEGIFKNIEKTSVTDNISYWEMICDFLFGDEIREPEMQIPVFKLTKTSYKKLKKDMLQVTWIGHSTLLIEIDGKRILTDPVWSETIGPSSIIGIDRFYNPPIKIKDLPKIDMVIISHDHYDHLDMDTVIELAKTKVKFITPLGVGAHLEFWGIDKSQIIEQDWWDKWTSTDKNLKIVTTPSRHFSGRTGESNTTLWASWVIIGKNHKVFFSGDSGPSSVYKKIGKKYGPFDATFIEIGAYGKWVDIHMNPHNALKTNKSLKGKILIPIHWGTFSLALHDWFEPAEWLMKEAKTFKTSIFIPKPGQIIDILSLPKSSNKWWKNDIPNDYKLITCK